MKAFTITFWLIVCITCVSEAQSSSCALEAKYTCPRSSSQKCCWKSVGNQIQAISIEDFNKAASSGTVGQVGFCITPGKTVCTSQIATKSNGVLTCSGLTTRIIYGIPDRCTSSQLCKKQCLCSIRGYPERSCSKGVGVFVSRLVFYLSAVLSTMLCTYNIA